MLQKTLNLYRESFRGLPREIWYLSATLFVNRAGNMVIPFLTLYLTVQRGFTLSRAGLIMASFGVGSVVGSYVGGRLTERYGFYRVQLWALIGSGLIFFWIMWLESFLMLCVGVAVLSTVADAFRPASQTAITHYSTPENRARAFGLRRLAVNLGFSAGPAVAGLLIAGVGYQALFVVDGITCLAAAVFFYKTVPYTGAETEIVVPVLRLGQPLRPQNGSPYRDRLFLAFVFSNFLGAVGFIQFFSTLPVYLQTDLHYTELQIGALVTINGVLIVATEMPLVHYLAQHYSSVKLIIIGAFLYGLGYLILPLASWLPIIPVVFIFIITIGEMLNMPFSSTWVSKHSEGKRRALYMGLYSLGFSLAFITAPALGTWWAERFGFPALWLLAGCCGLVSALIIVGLRHRMEREEKLL